jgi:predicted amino acid racemase
MTYPLLTIDPQKIEHNTGLVASLLQKQGMRLVSVAKGTAANLDVVGAMIKGGAAAIGDSRIANLARIREWGYRGETVLLRAPGPAQCMEAVTYADTSLNSEISTVRCLGEAAVQAGRSHNVILMVDLGDLREGVLMQSRLLKRRWRWSGCRGSAWPASASTWPVTAASSPPCRRWSFFSR